MGLSVIAEGVENEQQRSFSPISVATPARATCSAVHCHSRSSSRCCRFLPLGAGPLAIPENLLGDTNRIGQSKEMRG